MTLADRTSRVVDAAYVEQSIRTPHAFARPGYAPVMPSYEGQLSAPERGALVALLASLVDVP